MQLPLLPKFPAYSPTDLFDRVDYSEYPSASSCCYGSTFGVLEKQSGDIIFSSASIFRSRFKRHLLESFLHTDLANEWVGQSYRG